MTIPRHTPDMRLLAVIVLLYVTQGIPLGLAMEAFPTLLRQDGAPLGVLSCLPLVGLPWIVKLFWAPLVDNHWSAGLGKRRSWILPMQATVLACLLAVAMIGLNARTATVAIALFALASLASATQDIATDGLAAERFSGVMLVRANGIQIAGTMIGFFLGGSGCLILTGLWGRSAGMLGVAGIVAAGLLAIACWREGEPVARADRDRHDRAIPNHASLRGFLARRGAGSVLAIALLTAMAASAPFALFKLMLVDRGWGTAQIGALGMSGGVATVLVGCGGGTWLITRVGLRRVQIAGLMALALSAGLWLAVALGVVQTLPWPAMLAVIAGSVGSGAASVCAMSLAMRFAAQGDQAATDMTAVQSSRDLGEMVAASAAAALAGMGGYGLAFGLAFAVAVAAMPVAGRSKLAGL